MDSSYVVTESARNVCRELGSGYRENVYHQALIAELSKNDIEITTEPTIPVYYAGKPVARVHPDLIVGDGNEKFIVELKAGSDGTDQLQTYIDTAERAGMSDIEGGVMVSFGDISDFFTTELY